MGGCLYLVTDTVRGTQQDVMYESNQAYSQIVRILGLTSSERWTVFAKTEPVSVSVVHCVRICSTPALEVPEL